MHDETSDQANANPPAETPAPAGEAAADPVARALSSRAWDRRSFLRAAALGTAAAALLNSDSQGINFGPLSALANDLSQSPCTAQDVEIIGTGLVTNPCDPACSGGSGTFTARVQFTVRNNTSAGRYCIALHLPAGFGVPGQDVILRDANGSSTAPGKSGGQSFRDTVMFGDVVGFPCNATGLVCIGTQGVTTGKCAPNTCTTIAWNTTPNAAGCTTADQSPPGGQCRHQGICIQGFGVSLACLNCPPACNGEATLRATTSAPASLGPFTYLLTGSDGSSQSFGPTSATTHDFSVTVQGTVTYTVRVTGAGGCFREASLTVTAEPPPTVSLDGGSAPNCLGNLTFTASASGGTGPYTFSWTIDGQAAGGSGNTLAYPPRVDCAPHIVSVTATDSRGCPSSNAASRTVTQVVCTTVA
jgi:hypothetical protein